MARKKIERNISYDDTRGKFYVNLDFGKDPETGKQIKKTQTFDRITHARAALRKHEAARDVGQIVIPRELTVRQWLKNWMNDVVKLSREATTVYAYEKMIDNHINPVLGDVPIQKLTPMQLQQYYAGKIRNGELSSNTVRKHHDLLSSALRMAVKQGIILDSPAAKVEPPVVKRPEIHYYSLEELQTLLQLCEGDRLEVLIKLAGLLGLRREEIMGLTWDCVDFENKRIEISEVRTTAGKVVVTKGPKTSTSKRTLYMPPDIEEMLKRTKEKQEEYQRELGDGYKGQGYVFSHEDGRMIRPNYASELFRRFIEKNDLPPITLHGLRHSFASIANAKGIPMYDKLPGKLTVSATNMEIGLEVQLPCSSGDDDAVVINTRLLTAMLDKLSGEFVSLKREKGTSQIMVASGQASYLIPVWERASFPSMEIPFPDDTVRVSGIPAMAKKTVFATSQSTDKPLLRCVNLMFTKDGLKAAGSNGTCFVTASGDNKSTGNISLLLPAHSLDKLARMSCDQDEFRVGTTGKELVFFKEDFVFSARLMDGGYINTEQIVSSITNAFTVLTDVQDLRSALYSVTSVEENGRVKLLFDGHRLTFCCSGAHGSATKSLDVIPMSGVPRGEYWFLSGELMACLRSLTGTVTLGIAQGGMLTLSTEDAFYMQTAVRAPAASAEHPKNAKKAA